MGANLVEIDATTNESERFFSRFPCAKSKNHGLSVQWNYPLVNVDIDAIAKSFIH